MRPTLYKMMILMAAVLMLMGGALSEATLIRSAQSLNGEETACTVTASGSWKRKVVALNWYEGGSRVLKKGKYGYLYDVKSGISLKIKRMGGSAHADVEPATKSDTAKLKRLGYSWKRRPAILYAGGKFVACSFATEPHGDQTIHDNGFDGQFCLHMLGSKTHGSDNVDADHQSAVRKAYNWAH